MSMVDPERIDLALSLIRRLPEALRGVGREYARGSKIVSLIRFGVSVEHLAIFNGCAGLKIELAKDEQSVDWDSAMVAMDPTSLGVETHPLGPEGHVHANQPATVADVIEPLMRAAARMEELLLFCRDPANALSREEARLVRTRISAIAVTLAEEDKADDEHGFDVVAPSHEGPMAVIRWSDAGNGARNLKRVSDPRFDAWARGLPPIIGLTTHMEKWIIIRPMLMPSTNLPDDIIGRLRLAAQLPKTEDPS